MLIGGSDGRTWLGGGRVAAWGCPFGDAEGSEPRNGEAVSDVRVEEDAAGQQQAQPSAALPKAVSLPLSSRVQLQAAPFIPPLRTFLKSHHSVTQAGVLWQDLGSLQILLPGLSDSHASASQVAGTTGSGSFASAGMQGHDLCSLQSLPSRLKPSFFLSLLETRFHHVVQAGLELLDSSDPLTLASQIGVQLKRSLSVCHHADLGEQEGQCGQILHCHPGWSAVAWPLLTATSTSWVQAILLPHAPTPSPCSWDYRRVPQRPANFFVFLVETRFHYVGQTGLKLLFSAAPLYHSKTMGMVFCGVVSAWFCAAALTSAMHSTLF
ncbi:UPF0764 protein C16orf89 [Plecturocebus cupreus]